MTTSAFELGKLIREYRAHTAAEFWTGAGLLLGGWAALIFGGIFVLSNDLALVGSFLIPVGGILIVKAFLGRRRRLLIYECGLVLSHGRRQETYAWSDIVELEALEHRHDTGGLLEVHYSAAIHLQDGRERKIDIVGIDRDMIELIHAMISNSHDEGAGRI